jgi:hypothetical protein
MIVDMIPTIGDGPKKGKTVDMRFARFRALNYLSSLKTVKDRKKGKGNTESCESLDMILGAYIHTPTRTFH